MKAFSHSLCVTALQVGFLLLCGHARAEEAVPNASGVTVFAPSDPSHWKIDYIYDDEAKGTAASTASRKDAAKEAAALPAPQSSSSRRLKSCEVTYSGGKAAVIKTWSDGATNEYFLTKNYRCIKEDGKPVIDEFYPVDPDRTLLKKFVGTETILPKSFVGVVDAYGQSCRYYKRAYKTVVDPDADSDAPKAEGQEVVNELWTTPTGLPVAFKQAGVTGKYTFFDRPTDGVDFPQEFLEMILELQRPAPPPGVDASRPRPKALVVPPRSAQS